MADQLSRETRERDALKEVRTLYLDLLKGCLTRELFPERYRPLLSSNTALKRKVNSAIQALSGVAGLALVRRNTLDRERRRQGRDWPVEAETMIGHERLDNIQRCIETVLDDEVPGDLIETGVWRGGAVIFMRAVLRAYGITDRTVWAADSFAGLPEPNAAKYPADAKSRLFDDPFLAVSVELVKNNFRRYGLLDDQVRFLQGWFRDTLPGAPIQSIAVLRLDGDLYESTMDALTSLYPRLSTGGFCIIDDYHSNRTCRLAVEDYRYEHAIDEEMIDIDRDAVYWRKSPVSQQREG